MSKRPIIIPVVLALAAFVLVLYGTEMRHRAPIRRAAAPQKLASTNVESKPAQQAAIALSGTSSKQTYSEEEYNRLWQQYKPNLAQADGPLSADRLDNLAQTTKGMMDDREMWPVVADVIYGKAAAVEEMLDSGRLRADARFFMDYPLNDFQSLLDIAIEAGQRNVIKVLLNHHADINTSEVTTPEGKSIPIQGPLTVAAHDGEDDVVRLLLQEGADINQLTGFPKNNETALAAAVYSQNVSTVYLLLTQGADITSTLGPGGTVPPFLIQPPQTIPIPRMAALRDLLIAYGAKMPSS
jgi:hypothetical protein